MKHVQMDGKEHSGIRHSALLGTDKASYKRSRPNGTPDSDRLIAKDKETMQ